jgi:hypothetical protein
MDSINYFINMNNGSMFLIRLLFLLFCLGISFAIAMWAGKQYRLSDSVSKLLFYLCLFLGAALAFSCMAKFTSYYDRGGIQDIHIVPEQGGPYLTVWSTRVHSKRVGADYDQLLMTYNLKTGKLMGRLEMIHKHYASEYNLYWSHGDKAWGYSSKEGIQLLDMKTPKLIAGMSDLVRKNPDLKGLTLTVSDTVFSPSLNSVYGKAVNGQLYQLKDNMSAQAVDYIPDTISDSYKKWRFKHNWYFQNLKTSMGKHVHTNHSQCSSKSLILLQPEFIAELNPDIKTKKRIWVFHKSSMLGDSDPMIAYMSGDGRAHSIINLKSVTGYNKVKVLYTYTYGKEVVIFVTSGVTRHTIVSGFTLFALCTDINTGEPLATIKYF